MSSSSPTYIDIEKLADHKDFQLELGPLENKADYKYMRVSRTDTHGGKGPIILLLRDLKVRFPYAEDTRGNRVRYNIGVELDESRVDMKRGFERLNDLLVEQIMKNRTLVYSGDSDAETMVERDVRRLYFPIASYKKKQGKNQNADKLYDPTLTLHARMVTNKETNRIEPIMTVIDTEKNVRDPHDLTYGSVIDVFVRVSHLWCSTKANCNLQIMKIGCKQFGVPREEVADFDWEHNSNETKTTTDAFSFGFEGNSDMQPQPMDNTESATSPKRAAEDDLSAPRPRKRARKS